MAYLKNGTEVKGVGEIEKTYIKRTGKFLFFFKTEWWEQVNEQLVANDIHIKTDSLIRYVYINGVKINSDNL